MFKPKYPSYLHMLWEKYPAYGSPEDIEEEYKFGMALVEHTIYNDEIHWSELE